ncbi:MAG: S41 family peptidase [Bacteroidales bacterium]|nr:S41 family peptidase [Bacteroidales bacterium]MBN2817406.1 S41 family peptidase [Bacteroidales bacterium]
MKKTIQKIKNNKRTIIIAASILIISFGFVRPADKDFEIAKNLDIFVTMFREISSLYVDAKEPKELIDASIEGMLSSLDPYSSYIPEEDIDEFKFMTTGKYGGIGALIRKAGAYTMISEPYEGFPAQKSDVRAGDTIITIDGVSTKNKSINEVSELLKGNPNTELKLELKRIGVDSVITKTFNRKEITIPNVPYYGMMKGDIGYIMLGNFMRNSGLETKTALTELKEKGAKAIILDLRGNPGGLLNEAVNVTNIFTPRGQEVVTTRGKNKEIQSVYKTTTAPVDTVIPLAVLVNRGSASASEIVAGSLQDLDRAVIIGQRTFGKGLVQTTRPLSYNAHVKFTTAKYYIPSGRCIQAVDYSNRNEDGSVGIIPDSLKTEFNTRNGRLVYDGGGVEPDIKIEGDSPGNITLALYTKNLLFDFATLFHVEKPKITMACAFEITDSIYNSFIEYVLKTDFDYNTSSSEKLNELTKISKREGYYDLIKDDINSLEAKLHGDTRKDLETFRKEIAELLKDEIVSRYYFQKGRVEASLQEDPEVNKAMEILENPVTISKILDGSYEGETVFAYRSH